MHYLEKFRKTVLKTPSPVRVPSDTIAYYSTRLPEDILHLWREDGWAGYMGGRLWTIDPAVYAPVAYQWIQNDSEVLPFFQTAYGDLIVYYEGPFGPTVKTILFRKQSINVICDEELEDLFELYFFRSENFKQAFDSRHFSQHCDRFGPLAHGQCYAWDRQDIARSNWSDDTLRIRKSLSFMQDVTQNRINQEQEDIRNAVWLAPAENESDQAGWAFGLPPGIAPEQWPRSRKCGAPLMHGFTIAVPERFRAKGNDYVALSYFHPGDCELNWTHENLEDDIAAVLETGKFADAHMDHPFWQALSEHARSRHPATYYMEDLIYQTHAVVWHTQEAFESESCPRPETQLPEGIDPGHLQEPVKPSVPLGDSPALTRHIHLGWPLAPVQRSFKELVEQYGFSRFTLEIETDAGGANYGDGNCQIDLLNDKIFWSCT